MAFQSGDTISLSGKKTICVLCNSIYDKGNAHSYVSHFLLPFFDKKYPETLKCFMNGATFIPQKNTKLILLEKTHPFFQRTNKIKKNRNL
jgi:hypothetical protein